MNDKSRLKKWYSLSSTDVKKIQKWTHQGLQIDCTQKKTRKKSEKISCS